MGRQKFKESNMAAKEKKVCVIIPEPIYDLLLEIAEKESRVNKKNVSDIVRDAIEDKITRSQNVGQG